MRGLSSRPGPDGPPPPRRRAWKAASTAVAGTAALGLFAASCATGGTGARDEGPAGGHGDQRAAATVSPSAGPSGTRRSVAEVIELVKADAAVSKAVKRDLKPCVADEYPVDVSYGDLTGGRGTDIVVNVMTCGDAVGLGAYVYRERGGEYRNVFRAEEPPVYAEIDRGDLVVTQQLYEKDDPVSYPSSEEVITYRWSADRFTEQSRTHNDYSNAVGAADSPVPAQS